MKILYMYTDLDGNLVIVYANGNQKVVDAITGAVTLIDTKGNYFHGTSADETIIGTADDDKITAGGGNDFVDGGSGSDLILAGGGDDIARWVFADTATDAEGALDYYNGGGTNRAQGNDILRMEFTLDELDTLSLSYTNSSGTSFTNEAALVNFFNDSIPKGNSADFRDLNPNLTLFAINFETIEIVGPPRAQDDAASTDEDNRTGPINVLVNDADVSGGPVTLDLFDTVGASGMGIITRIGDNLFYDPNGEFEFLAVTESTTDTFTYTISDIDGNTDTATVTVIIDGVNDAPIARDDQPTTNEDASVLIEVLLNDTDVDATDVLTIISTTDPTNGSVVINSGSTITYTPVLNYSGPDSFSYTISDNHGVTDFATVAVTVTPVADVPTLSVETQATALFNQVKLVITSTLTDTDGSETLALTLEGIPAGIGVSGATQIGATTSYSVVDLNNLILTLPSGVDTDFDLIVRARATETANNDTADATQVIDIILDHTSNGFTQGFTADNQNLWSSGDAFGFVDNRFIGIDLTNTTANNSTTEGIVTLNSDINELSSRIGLNSQLDVNGGSIDAFLPYSLTLDTIYNQTTDILHFDTSALLTGGGYNTSGPRATYDLSLVANVNGGVSSGLANLPAGFDKDYNVDNSIPIINFNSETNPFFFFQIFGGILSAKLIWPTLNSTGVGSDGFFTSSAQSPKVLELTLDVDDAIFSLLSLPNPFKLSFNFGIPKIFSASIRAEALDFDLNTSFNIFQQFSMDVKNLSGNLVFEDGSSQLFTFGDSVDIPDASAIDNNIAGGGDGDGLVEFNVIMDPLVGMTNQTFLRFFVGFELQLLQIGANVSIFGQTAVAFDVGPLFTFSQEISLIDILVHNNIDFALDFGPQTSMDFFA